MSLKPLLLLLLFLPQMAVSQTGNSKLVDSLQYITAMPYIALPPGGTDVDNNLFWRVVQQKQDIIPLLIQKLSDTTQTVAVVPNFGGQYAVADIAYATLEEIIHHLPTFELLQVKFNKNGCGYCAYWKHVRRSFANRIKFQAAVSSWYNRNKTKLRWVTSNDFATCDCRIAHPNRGHYEVNGHR